MNEEQLRKESQLLVASIIQHGLMKNLLVLAILKQRSTGTDTVRVMGPAAAAGRKAQRHSSLL